MTVTRFVILNLASLGKTIALGSPAHTNVQADVACVWFLLIESQKLGSLP